MTAQILDGKTLAVKIFTEIAHKIKKRVAKGQSTPCLAAIIVGEDPASKIYVGLKIKNCEQIGIISKHIELPESTSQNQLLDLIEELNTDPEIHGILVQAPLPKHIDKYTIIKRIIPHKDVDGFHPCNAGALFQNHHPLFVSCTPKGCMELLKTTKEPLRGKHAVVVGASTIVGRPMAMELLNAGCTITICNSKTPDLSIHVKQGDIVVAAVGKPKIIKGEWIKESAIVIDVGITRMEDGKLCGDVEFDVAKERAAWITPVPGGVGPMTRAMLMENTLLACEQMDK